MIGRVEPGQHPLRVPELGSMLLRGGSLGSKFLLLLVMARYFALDDIGRYGLAVAAVGILSRLAGMEFYTFTTRLLVDADAAERWRIINGHFAALSAGLAAAMLACFGVANVLDLGMSGWLLAAILLVHHLSLEATRILIAVGRAFWSYAIGAIANGMWPLGLIALWAVDPGAAVLSSVWWAWLAGAALGCVAAMPVVARSIAAPWRAGLPMAGWVSSGMRTAGLFLVSATALRAVEFADRFMVQAFLGTAAVGVYTYYATFAKLVVELPTVLVVAPRFPEVVGAMRSGSREGAGRIMRAFSRRCIALAAVSVPLLFAGLWGVSVALGKAEIWSSPPAFAILLLANLFMAASFGGHYALYGSGADRTIASIAVASAVVAVATGVPLTWTGGLPGAATATLLAMMLTAGAATWRGRQALHALPISHAATHG